MNNTMEFNKAKIDILGTEYTVAIVSCDKDSAFERNNIDGYCDFYTKQIVICDLNTWERWKNEPQETKNIAMKESIKHEIVHAFLNESGLDSSSVVFNQAWAINEEMVDWIAKQGEKIYKAWQEIFKKLLTN